MATSPVEEQSRGISAAAFKEALRTLAGPATILTALEGERAHATTVSALCSLSASPPLVLACLERSSHLLGAVLSGAATSFAVHLLKPGHEELALHCATKQADKLRSCDWQVVEGVPRISGAGTWLRCEVRNTFDGGDHVMVVGLVTHSEVDDEACLVYRNRAFHVID